MNTAPKSPGYYGSEIYGYIGNTDPSFSKDISQEQFLEDLQDEAYAAEIYGYLTKKDRSFAKDVSLDQFIVDVKKKEIVTASAGGDTSSELLPTTEVTPEVAQALGEAVALQGFEPNPFRPDDPYGYTPQEQERRFALAQQVDEQQQVIEEQPEIIGGTAQQTVPFVSGLGLEHDEYGAKYTDSFVEDMRNLYSPYGFRVEGEVHNGRGDIKVYNNVDGKLLSHTVRVRSGYIPNSEVGALKDFLYEIPAQRIDMPDDQRGMTEKALRAQEMRPTYRQNRDGKTVSTHLMAYAEVDGKFVAYPTLFPDRPESISTRFDMWTELDGNEALDEAYRRDEVFVFDTEEEAKMFAEGAWKDIETIDLEGERLYRERGRDYYSEQAAEFELDRLNTEYKFIERLKPGEQFEGEIPASYQKYFIEGNRVRPDIEIMRSGLESEVDMMFDSLNDEETTRLREDFDVILGKRQKAKAAEAAEVNQAARIQQDKLQIESLKKFGVRINDLVNYEPKTQREFQEVNNIIGRFNTAITDRMVAAKMYEKAELYYDKKHNKQVTDDYVEGLATWGLEWDKATDKGNAMALLLKTNFGLIDEEDEEKVAKQIAAYMDEDDHRLSRQKTRVNEAATSHQYWQNLGDNPLDYTISIMAESMGQLLPLGATIVPYFAVPGAVKGAATGMVGGPYGALGGAIRGAAMGAGRAAFMYGMPLSEFALEMGNSIIEEGNERGYDWADPQQALLAFNDKELWRAGTVRGVQRGVPIALASHLSNAVAGRVFTSSALAPMKTRIGLGLAERLTVDPALEMAGEYGALVMEGKYTGSLSDMREIIAEGLGAIGQSTPMYALNIAQDAMTNNTFDLAMGLIDPKVLAEENVSNKRIMDWTDNAQKTGKITAETADFIRKNVGYRREANEILGRKAGARPGRKSAVLGRIMELLEAKDALTRSASVREVFKKRIAEINEEIAIIAETGKLPESPIVDLSLVAERTQRDKPSGYRIGKKAYTRAAFVNELDKLSRRQLFNAQVYNDPLVAQLLIQKTQDAVQKRKAKKIPVRDEAGVSPEMEQEAQDFSEANEEDLKAQESETLTDNRLATILGNIAAKLDAQEKLSDVEQQFYEEHKDDIDGYTNEEGEFVPGIRGEVVEAEEIIPPGEITPEEEEVTPEEEPTPDIEPDPDFELDPKLEAYPDPTEEQKAEYDPVYPSNPKFGYWRVALIKSRQDSFIAVGGANTEKGQQVAAEFAAVFKVLNNMQLTPEQIDILGRVAHKTGDPVLALKEATGIDLGPSLGLGPTEVAAKDTAAEPTPEPTPEPETTVEEVAEAIEEELMPELTKGELAKLLKERPNLRLAYFGKDGRRDTEFTIGYSRATGKYFFSDNNRIYRSSDYDKFSQALKRLLYQKRRGLMPSEFIGLYDTNMPSEGVLAKFDLEMNKITEAEPTVEEAPTVEEEVAPEEEVTPETTVEEELSTLAEVEAKMKRDNRVVVWVYGYDTKVDDTPRTSRFYVEYNGKAFQVIDSFGVRNYKRTYKTLNSALKALENTKKLDETDGRTDYTFNIKPEAGFMVFNMSGSKVLQFLNEDLSPSAEPPAKPTPEPTVEEEVAPEPTVEEELTEDEQIRKAAEKRAAIEGISVEVAEKQIRAERAQNMTRRIATEVRKARAELTELKGKNDKASRVRRKVLNEFLTNIRDNMALDEAIAIRDATVEAEPTVEEDPFLAVLTEPYRVIEQATTAEEIYREIYSRIKDGGLTAKKVYEAMSKNTNLDEVQRAIAKSLAEKLDESVKIRGNARLRTYGYYFYNYSRTAGDVTVSRIELKNPKDELKFDTYVETLLHEGVHAATSLNYLGGKPEFRVEMDRIVSLVKKHLNGLTEQEIRSKYPELYAYLRKGAKVGRRSARAYRMDPEEIMAWGLTNPEMQALMKSIKDPKGESVWSSFVTAIRELMGLAESENTAFDSLLTAYEGSYAYKVGETIDPQAAKGGKSAMGRSLNIQISDELYQAAIFYGLNENGFIPDNALQKDINAFKSLLERNGLTLAKAKNGGLYVAIKNTRVPYDLYTAYDVQQEELNREIAEIEALEEQAQRERELQERLREIHDADVKPYTGRDFEGLGSASAMPDKLVDPASSIADVVTKGRAMGYRDAAIRALLIKRFGKENIDAINQAMTEYFDAGRAIPEAFGNVEGGIDVGREIYSDVRRQLDEFIVSKRKKLTKKQRAERIADLRQRFPEDKELNDTKLLRKHSKDFIPPSMSIVRAAALNFLESNEQFKQQPKQVQEELLVSFDKALKTRANRDIQARIMRLRFALRERKRGEKNLKKVQNELRALIREVLPKSGYSAAQVNTLLEAVVNTNEKTIATQAEKVLNLVEGQRNKMRKALIKNMVGFVKKSKTTYRTKSGRIRTRTLDAPGQAYFESIFPILSALAKNDLEAISRINDKLVNNPDVDLAVARYMAREQLTTREQRLVDEAAAFDMFGDLQEKSLEELEAIFEDIRLAAGFSRVALKNTRLARAARYKRVDDAATDSLAEEYPFLVDEQGNPLNRNQIEAIRNIINQKLRSGTYREKVEALRAYMKLWSTRGVGKVMDRMARPVRSLGTLTNGVSNFLYRNVYDAVNEMDEQYHVGAFEQKDELDAMAASIEGIKSFKDLIAILYDGNTKNFTLRTKQGASYQNVFNKDQAMRIYALSLNPVQAQKLEAQGFTPEVMAELKEFIGPELVQFADKAVEYLSTSYYESVNDVYRRVNDINLPYVENYFPTRSVTGQIQQELLTTADFSRIFDAETSPAFKDRTDTKSEVDLSASLSFSQTLTNHIEQMERYKAYAEGTKQINHLFKNKMLDASLEAFKLNDHMRKMVNWAINPNSARLAAVQKYEWLDPLLNAFSKAVLGFKFFQIPKQLSSFITALQEYQYRTEDRIPIIDPIIDRLAFMAEYAAILPAVFLDLGRVLSTETPKGPVYEAMGISKTFARRLEQFSTGNIYTLESGVTTFRSIDKQEAAVGKGIRFFRKAQAGPIMIGDAGAIMAYLVTYRRNIKNGMDPAEALLKFNDYNITQQSRRPGDKVPAQISGNALERTFIMFGSSIIGLTNNAIVGWQNMVRDVKRGKAPKSSDARRVWLSMVSANVLFSLVSNASIFLLSDDDDEKRRALQDALISPLNGLFMIPIVGGSLEAMAKSELYGYQMKGSSIDVFERTYRDAKKGLKEGDVVEAVKPVTELVLGANLDPFIALGELVGNKMFDLDVDVDDATYEALGIPKSQRPE